MNATTKSFLFIAANALIFGLMIVSLAKAANNLPNLAAKNIERKPAVVELYTKGFLKGHVSSYLKNNMK